MRMFVSDFEFLLIKTGLNMQRDTDTSTLVTALPSLQLGISVQWVLVRFQVYFQSLWACCSSCEFTSWQSINKGSEV